MKRDIVQDIGSKEEMSLIRFKARDRFSVSSLLVTRKYEKLRDILAVPIVIQIPGLLGHFLARGTPRLLPHELAARGVSSLTINTRLAYAGQIVGTGIFDDTIHDIDVAVEFLTISGFENIYILGYSLGASMLVHWASKRENKNVKGLILEGSHYSIPDSWKKDFDKWGSSPTYDEVYQRAKEILGPDPYNSPNDETFIVYQSRGPTREPINSEIFTYKTWWHMAGPEAYNAMAYKNMHKVPYPVLMVRGDGDFLVEDWEPDKLASIAHEAGNKHVHVRHIENARHDCMENTPEFLKEIHQLFSHFTIE
ncbi:MAG: alpha/beta fold hydrolase [Candidatus Ancaeobacter aquaticus]|nr:alpha/beta fold hydrolase [Candidatus Ancaeobacter aquaticus]